MHIDNWPRVAVTIHGNRGSSMEYDFTDVLQYHDVPRRGDEVVAPKVRDGELVSQSAVVEWIIWIDAGDKLARDHVAEIGCDRVWDGE